MHGLPGEFDGSAFVGAELVSVSFSVNTVRLLFEPDAEITIMASFIVQAGADLEPVRDAPPVASSSVMALVGAKVCSASGTADGTLALHFDSGGSVVCVDDSRDYESYTFRINGGEFVV
jgi:hypothetical protein